MSIIMGRSARNSGNIRFSAGKHSNGKMRAVAGCYMTALVASLLIMNPVICNAAAEEKLNTEESDEQKESREENKNTDNNSKSETPKAEDKTVIKGRIYTNGNDKATFMVSLCDDKYVFSALYETDENWKTAIAFIQTYGMIKDYYIATPYNRLVAKTADTENALSYGNYPQMYSYGISDGKEIDPSGWITNRLFEAPEKEGLEFYEWIEEINDDFRAITKINPTQKDISPDFEMIADADDAAESPLLPENKTKGAGMPIDFGSDPSDI